MGVRDDAGFWAHVEGIETDYAADCDRKRFRRRMRRKGFDADVIAERETGIDEALASVRGIPPQ